MAASRWMFTKEQLMNTPSRKCGIDADKELSYRQQAANLIQDMGQRLSVTQLCINTAIVYMHRFYMFRSFSRFPRNEMAPACLFLAAKVEEQPRKLEHVIKVAHSCLHRDNTPAPNVKTEAYLEQAQILVMNENVLLQTLGFEVTVDHPHTHVVKATQLVKASKDLAQTSYFLATNSLHLTALCLQFRPTIVACVCIYLACKWSNWKIPRSNEGKEWFQYVDRSVTAEMLEEVYQDFLRILEKCPHKLRKKIMGYKGGAGKDEEYQRSVNEQMRRPQAESSHFSASASQEANRPSSSSTQHKHLNHERKDSHDVSKEHHPDQRHSHDQRDSRGEFKKEWQHERKESHSDKKLSGDRKESSSNSDNKKDSHHQDLSKSLRKDGHSEKRDPHSDRKDALSTLHRKDLHLDKRESGEHRDRLESPHEKKDSAQFRIKTEPNSDVRSHSGSHPLTTAQPTSTKIESSSDNGSVIVESDQTCQQNTSSTSHTNISSSSEIRKVKSETALNYKVYLKRKEQEKLEKEKLHKQKVDSDNLNKTFSEGNERDRKHRPPKLDISLPVHGSGNHRQSHGQDRNERPYEVTCNIKSPIKPHYNITVKSPIKSSDLKQPKIEINKVQITPEKEGGDPFSVNINSDPNIKKIMENIKQEPGVSNLENAYTDQTDSPSLKIKIKSETSDSKLETRHERIDVSNVKIKYEQSDDLESEISLQPEHVTTPNFKIKELRYDPENGGLDSAASLRLAIKHDSISGHTTPVVSQCRSESGSGASTPIRLKIPLHTSGESSPLKLKISTKGLKAEHEHGSSKYHSPHRHHKDKHKHKSRKHSRDREKHRDKEKHKEKHGSSSTSSSGANGQPLKMSIKLSDIPGQSGSGAESWSVKSKHDKHRHKVSISDPALNRNNSAELERQQPWSMSDLISKSTSAREKSPSRKRRRTPTVDQNNDISSHPKTAKTDTTQQHHRIRRSSSSHSIVSMEMSDGEDTGQNNGPDLAVDHPKDKLVNQLQANLQQMIDQTKLKIQHQQYIQNKKKSSHSVSQESRRLDRQQSGFDLEGMMWAGNNSDPPPLPPGSAPPLPSTPAPRTVAPPPPPH